MVKLAQNNIFDSENLFWNHIFNKEKKSKLVQCYIS